MIKPRVWRAAQTKKNGGFTMIELLTILVTVGVLIAIASPSFLSFSRNQRANGARERIQQVLRQSQTRAQRTRMPQTVLFVATANPPTIAGSDGIQSLADKPGLVGLTAKNGTTNITEVKFDSRGHVIAPVLDTNGVKITAVAPSSGGVKRCVIIHSLLGAMRSGKDTECD